MICNCNLCVKKSACFTIKEGKITLMTNDKLIFSSIVSVISVSPWWHACFSPHETATSAVLYIYPLLLELQDWINPFFLEFSVPSQRLKAKSDQKLSSGGCRLSGTKKAHSGLQNPVENLRVGQWWECVFVFKASKLWHLDVEFNLKNIVSAFI